jgi:hypothetical protein
MFLTKYVEKIKTCVFMSNNYFPETCAIFEMMWKNVVQPDRPQITIAYNTAQVCCVLNN